METVAPNCAGGHYSPHLHTLTVEKDKQTRFHLWMPLMKQVKIINIIKSDSWLYIFLRVYVTNEKYT